ncbi:MAG: zinc ribbon domain-containing protein [Thermomicrobiales bacterium]
MDRSPGVFCPTCGTRNLATAQACRSCGELLPRRQQLGQRITATRARFDPSLQETQAIRWPTPAAPPTRTAPRASAPPSPPPTAPSPPSTPVSAPSTHYPLAPAVQPQPRTNPRFTRGPHGCILGLVALVMMCAVAGSFAWLVGRPLLNDAIESEVDEGIATQVAGIERLPVAAGGDLRITEEEINEGIASYGESFNPVEDPRVEIRSGEISVGFDLYGSHSTYHGDLDVRDGRLVVVDARVDGPAGRFLDEDAFAEILEEQFAALMARFDLTPTDVRVADGVLVIETEEG